MRSAVRPGRPSIARSTAPPAHLCRVLKSADDMASAERQARDLGLCPVPDRAKQWDNLIAVDVIRHAGIGLDDPILDLGCRSGILLTWLHQLGYRQLHGCDLRAPLPPLRAALRRRLWWTAVWGMRMQWANRGRMKKAPLEASGFPSAAFTAVACMSVIEHGVDTDAFLREVARLLRAGGVLVLSTDYWPEKVDMGGLTRFREAHGYDRVFDRGEIAGLCSTAAALGLSPMGEPDLDAVEPVIESSGFRYTFLTLAFQRDGSG